MVVTNVDNSIHRINHLIPWIAQLVSRTLMHWIVIYPVAIALNNWGQINREITSTCNGEK